jgi:hypothetical protein
MITRTVDQNPDREYFVRQDCVMTPPESTQIWGGELFQWLLFTNDVGHITALSRDVSRSANQPRPDLR